MNIADVPTATDADLIAERDRLNAIEVAAIEAAGGLTPENINDIFALTPAEVDLHAAILATLASRYPDACY